MRSFKHAPGLLTCLLTVVVAARIAIAFLVDSPLPTAFAWAGLLCGLSLAALWGRQGAAKALAYLCLILGADTSLQLLNATLPRVHLVAALLWALLVIAVGAYILGSTRVKRFYARQPDA